MFLVDATMFFLHVLCIFFKMNTQTARESKESQWEGRERRPWIGDRWGGFIWLQRAPELFRLTLAQASLLSAACVNHVMCLSPRWEPTPAAADKKTQTMLLSLGLAQHVSGYFAYSLHFPPFPFLSGIHFYWPACFVSFTHGSHVKEAELHSPQSLLSKGACWEYLWSLITEVM